MSKPRVGLRAWGVGVGKDGRPVLAAPEFGTAMPHLIYPKRTARAVCTEHGHAPPHPECGCGLYSAATVDGCVLWLPPGRIGVIGKVELIGPTIESAAEPANLAMESLRPLVDAGLGMESSPEYRSAAVRLIGKQHVHPRYAAHIDECSERYGVPFKVSRWVRRASEADIADEMTAVAHRLMGGVSVQAPAAGLLLLNRQRTHLVLQKRSSMVDQPGTWALIGGQIDVSRDESAVAAALREGWEEARLQPSALKVKAEISLPATKRHPAYTYVVASARWTPDEDWALPQSANWEADGAGWLPLAVLDRPSDFPGITLHPALEKAWPKVRRAMR